MSLFVHLFLHIFTALLAGFVTWFFFGNPLLSFVGGILGGVLIDLDHLIDYFLAFRYRWKLSYFLRGHQFLKSNKIYILFHGWEYVILLAVSIWFIIGMDSRVGVFFISFCSGMFFHLVVDVCVNQGVSFKTYSFLYRLRYGFDVEKLVTAEHYKNHLDQKKLINL